MKVGVLTQILGTNYGGILQNFALHEVIKELGHDPVTINVGKRTWRHWIIYNIKSIINMLLRKPVLYLQTPISYYDRTMGLRCFVLNNITTTKPYFWYNPSIILENNIDALLVGSDQVWRPCYNQKPEDLFLLFAKDLNLKKRIAYAASFGVDTWEYNQKLTMLCKDLIQRFDHVSVREKSGLKLCEEFLNFKNAYWVLDPTLLISKEKYIEICKNIPLTKNKLIFAYLLDININKIDFLNKLSHRLNADIKIISAGPDIKSNDTIENWIAMFRDASYVVTDSYHGTIFSIIFNKEFTTLYNSHRGNTRMDSLMEITGLQNRCTASDTFYDLPEQINWDVVNQKIDNKRYESKLFLKQAFRS